MRKVFASLVVGTMMAAGLAATAQAAGGVTASYSCKSATFTNNTDGTVRVTYGTASSDDANTIEVAASASRTVNSSNPNFGWTARNADGVDVGHEWWPGVDLTARCATQAPTPTPTKKDSPKPKATTKPTKTATAASEEAGGGSRGLASTGVTR